MNYEETLSYIHSQKRFGPKPGLTRIRALLNRLGDPQKKLRFVHVAGTNGKGSTSIMTSRILEEAGYRVGTFISPFVLEFRERFQVNHEWITEEELTEITESLRPVVDEMNRTGEIVAEFELVTAIGMEYFARKGCDLVVLEVGIGGLYDSTNVIDSPLCAVITSISLDHTDILGNTLEEIAFQKAGIIKKETQVVAYPELDDGVLGVLMERCAETGSTLIVPNRRAIQVLSDALGETAFQYGDKTYALSLSGRHQAMNASVVLEVLRVLQKKGFVIPEEAVRKGFLAAQFPARMELLSRDPMLILDGAHNPGGAAVLRDALREGGWTAVIGMLREKAYEEYLETVSPCFERIITVPIENPRAISADDLAEKAGKYCDNVTAASSLKDGIEQAKREAAGGKIIICGSLYLASEVHQLLEQL